LKKLLLASENSEKNLKKYFKNLEYLEILLLMKYKIFHGNLPEARGLRELDHKQYDLERFYH
jgi:hypothetical protein